MPKPTTYTGLLFILLAFSFFFLFFHKSPYPSWNLQSYPIPMAAAVDPYKFLNITLNPDGSITRHTIATTTAANSTDPSADVWSKDIPLNPDNKTWIRLYLPRNLAGDKNKLPVIVYFHGGGFVFLSPDHAGFHAFCEYMALQLGVLVASVSYRLTPEHRLPAAYDDAAESLDLIRNSSDPWITAHGDISRCILMGESAGGNIAYQAGLRAGASSEHLNPLKIRGLVLIQPYFGGSERTPSENRLAEDPILPMSVCDLMWELSLPAGSDLDHEYCNPAAEGGSKEIQRIRDLGWQVVVTAVDGDPLFDREVDLAKLLEKKGVDVAGVYRAGFHHGIYLTNRVLDKEMFDVMLNKDMLSPFMNVEGYKIIRGPV
ncbi:hypothetical protein V2J09_014524 [Rumex salicifolius]